MKEWKWKEGKERINRLIDKEFLVKSISSLLGTPGITRNPGKSHDYLINECIERINGL